MRETRTSGSVGAAGGNSRGDPTAGAVRVVEHLGQVRIDSIAVVERAHHHVMWSRLPGYAPAMLDALQRDERRVFEHWWGHAASYLPMADYRYYLPGMRRFAASDRAKAWLGSNARLVDRILARIREEGALGSADFRDPGRRRRGIWWDWSPAKRALETLFGAGTLLVSERRNFQRLYDLAERVLPPGLDLSQPSRQESARFMVERALGTKGLVAPRELRWGGLGGQEAAEAALAELCASGKVSEVTVESLEGPWYARTEALEPASARGCRRPRLHLLSPFDALVMDRHRLRTLFDFDCRLECYLPAAKRRYGYFCLPMLWGCGFVGRLDPKADRSSKTLIVRALYLEREPGEESFLPALASEPRRFAAWNGCERVVIDKASPSRIRSGLGRSANVASA